MTKKQKKSKEREPVPDPRRNKTLLYIAFGLTIIGSAMAVIATIFIFMPWYELTWSNLFKIPWTYVILGGLVLITAGFIMQRVITPPMELDEKEALQSRLE